MSIQANYTGQLEHADSVSLTTTNVTAVVTGESELKVVASIAVINTHSSAVDVALYRYDGSANQKFWQQTVAANTTVKADIPIPLHQTTEEVRAQAASANHIEIYPVIMRQDRNAL